MTHNDPTRAEFGYVPAASDFSRSFDALERAQRHRDGEARYLADKTVEVPTYPHLDIAADYYRRAAAAHEYAQAVYEAESAKVRAR